MFARLRHIFRSSSTSGEPLIMARVQFHEFVRRERNRVHRTGDQFTLLLFPSEPKTHSKRTWRRLAAALARDLRSTDAIGWWRQHQLGCLLTSTEPAGARVVAMRAQAASGLEDLDFKIIRYPGEDQLPDDECDGPFERVVSQSELTTRIVQPMPIGKRMFDVIAATGGLLLLLPLFVVIALLIKCTSSGPVFFRQWRTGRGGSRFQMLKFRTMCEDAESRQLSLREMNERDGPAFKIANDPRVTLVGAMLRATSIDELPQLWNVLRGEMSLVGPRPLPCDESDACEAWQKERLDTTPGLTCFWQVGDRQRVTFTEWMRMDIRYGRYPSFWQDLSLIFRTLPVMLMRRGAR